MLCVTVTAATTADLRRRRDEIVDADLVELRLDSVADPDVAAALAGRRLPVIVTCRPRWEGGGFTGSEEERHRILADAISLGAEYVDLEWRAGFTDLTGQRGGRGIILSTHDFAGVPADLSYQWRAMRGTGAEIVKIAITAKRLADCLPLLELRDRVGADARFVLLAMGEHGVATRVLAARFGSAWTYAGALGDLGQIGPAALVHDYRFRSIGKETEIYAVTGGSVAHSVSPSMHNAAFRSLGLDAVYVPLPAVSADDFVTFGKAIGLRGASVTIPHKVTLCERLDEVSPVARRVGAVNTIRVDAGRWIGDNTDVTGFLRPLQDRVALEGLRAAVVGAGGAARAVVDALTSSGCRVTVHARNRSQADHVTRQTPASAGDWPVPPGSWDLLVNCTPIGQHPDVDATPIAREHLTGRLVYDLVYNPTPTRLLRDATEVGCQTIGGLEMLIAQAQEQFRLWTRRTASAETMREAARKRLAEFMRDEDYVV